MWKDPEYIEKVSSGVKKALANPETKEKISKLRSGSNNPRARAVEQYTKDGIFIAKYDTVTEAGKVIPGAGHITDVCLGKRKYSAGFAWRYANDLTLDCNTDCSTNN